MKPCPICKNGDVSVHRDYFDLRGQRRSDWQRLPCGVCNGTSEVSEAALERIKEGDRAREQRIENGVGLRAEAALLGISPSHLSRIENGLADEVAFKQWKDAVILRGDE